MGSVPLAIKGVELVPVVIEGIGLVLVVIEEVRLVMNKGVELVLQ